jgi:DNA-binding protein Alba
MIQQKELREILSIEPQEQKSKIGENEIFVGNKPFMKYVRSAEILLRNKNFDLILIRARGMNISKAVDLAESVKNKFCNDLKLNISDIKTSTENYMKENRDFSVSVIELTLKRTK